MLLSFTLDLRAYLLRTGTNPPVGSASPLRIQLDEALLETVRIAVAFATMASHRSYAMCIK